MCTYFSLWSLKLLLYFLFQQATSKKVLIDVDGNAKIDYAFRGARTTYAQVQAALA